jgi:hypothetical protein
MTGSFDEVGTTAGGMGSPTDQSEGLQYIDDTLLKSLRRIFSTYAGPDNRWDNDQINLFQAHVQSEQFSDILSDLVTSPHNLKFSDFLRYMTSPIANTVRPVVEEDVA